MKLLMVDTETGGLDPTVHSIFSVGAVIWEDGEVKDSLHVVVKEPAGIVTSEAININGFTRERIEREGVAPAAAVSKITQFCRKHKIKWGSEIGGHNVQFDVGFLKRLYSLAGVKYPFSHRVVCTQSAAIFLRLAGHLDVKNTGLDALCEKFNIAIRLEGSHSHDALEDITATAHLLTALIDLINIREG
jgi:DNA polymerase III epsilon subunit-like protein